MTAPTPQTPAARGSVVLLGAGPGAAGLLTVRGAEVLAEADLVVSVGPLPPAVAALVPSTVERSELDEPGTPAALARTLAAAAKKGRRVVLARAGLARLGRLAEVTEVIDPLQVLPAPAQGALAVECRSDDAAVLDLLHRLDDSAARAAVTAERSLLAALEAGCTAPVGAYAEVAEGEQGPELFLRAVASAVDGSDAVRLSATAPLPDAEVLGRRLAADMLEAGAGALLAGRP